MANNQVDVKAVITADDKASGVMSNFGNATQSATNKIAGAMVVAGAGLTLFTKNATDFTVELTKNTKALGRETGLTAESASALLYVTGRLGVSADEAQAVFGIFSKKINEAAYATDKSQTSFGKLGLSVQNADGSIKDFNSILLETADKFAKMPDGPIKTAEALDLFGRSGKDLIPVLNLGSQGIKDMEAQAEKLGLTLTSGNVASVTAYIKAQKDLADSTNALKVQIGNLTAPVLTALDNKLNSVISKAIQATGPFKGLAATAIAAGGPIFSFGGTILGVAANIEQALPLIVSFGGAMLAAAPYIVIAGAAVAGVAWVWHTLSRRHQEVQDSTDGVNSATDSLNQTLQGTVTTLDDVTAATRDYNRAQLDVTGANLSVERAQKDYNDAVKQYGDKSLEAREAAYNLQRAQMDLQDATDKATTSQANLNEKQADMARQAPGAVAATGLVAGAIAGITIQSDIAITHVADLSLHVGQTLSQSLNAASVIQGTFGNLQNAANNVQNAVGVAQGSAVNLQSTINNLNQSANQGIKLQVRNSQGIPLRAEGGPVEAGKPYWVGEEGIPELFVPQQSGQIVPLDKMGGKSGGSPAQQGGGITQVSVTLQAQAFMGNQIEARKFAQQIFNYLKDLAAAKNMSVADIIGN